ncbi:hypothetical protein NE865_01650 [Phthorimaea operculella]|nr:hypothetical protein NE865_01650 [Phthorimaea operculella]
MPHIPPEEKKVCGRTPEQAVQYVAICTALIAVISFIAAAVGLSAHLKPVDKNVTNPGHSIPVLLSLLFIPMSLYQFIISALLWYQLVKLNGNAFLTYVWLSSHITMCVIFFVLTIGLPCVCMFNGKTTLGAVTLVVGIVYEGVRVVIKATTYLSTLNSSAERYITYFQDEYGKTR